MPVVALPYAHGYLHTVGLKHQAAVFTSRHIAAQLSVLQKPCVFVAEAPVVMQRKNRLRLILPGNFNHGHGHSGHMVELHNLRLPGFTEFPEHIVHHRVKETDPPLLHAGDVQADPDHLHSVNGLSVYGSRYMLSVHVQRKHDACCQSVLLHGPQLVMRDNFRAADDSRGIQMAHRDHAASGMVFRHLADFAQDPSGNPALRRIRRITGHTAQPGRHLIRVFRPAPDRPFCCFMLQADQVLLIRQHFIQGIRHRFPVCHIGQAAAAGRSQFADASVPAAQAGFPCPQAFDNRHAEAFNL